MVLAAVTLLIGSIAVRAVNLMVRAHRASLRGDVALPPVPAR